MQELAAFAVSGSDLTEREHKEAPHPFRSDFQRDRDRIIHSNAFRRLEYKTQVFVNHLGDNYRTRLTHSIEVAQIARTMARALKLNEDLVETLALAHDLGHPPFGHAGEAALHRLMKPEGFDHNAQTLRVVTFLEHRYPDFRGLNLTHGARLGLQKHNRLPDGMAHTLEAQSVDICDEIAYTNHDIDDGLDSGYISLEQLAPISLWAETWEQTCSNHPEAPVKIQIRTSIRRMINQMVTDLIDSSQRRIEKQETKTLKDVLDARKSLVGFSTAMATQFTELKRFLFRNLYRHAEVSKLNTRAENILKRIFEFLEENTSSLPEEYRARLEAGESQNLVVGDFIAGMTDRYAMQWNRTILGVDT